jgi:23S rRNA pseudouridine2605 synthase
MKERIQKLLSRAGYGSRREIERWIEAGDILVNGKLAELGQPISEQDKVILRGKTLHLESKLRATPKVLMYHKKAGEMCTRHDPEGRPTVFDNLPHLRQGRWIMIGRLDVNTDGLLLFTTDGDLANKLMHPSSEVEREYATRILGEVDAEMLQRLQTGVQLEDGSAQFLRILEGGGEGANHWYHVVLAEGRNREVRRLWESQGVKVSRLIRVRYGFLSLPRSLRGGQYEELDVKTLRRLYESVGLSFEEPASAEHIRPAAYRPAVKQQARPPVTNPYSKPRKPSNSTKKAPVARKPPK